MAALHSPYDVILGSDILFFETEVSKLAETLIALSAPGAQILISGPDCLPGDRTTLAKRFYHQLREGGIHVSDVLAEGPKAKKLKMILDTNISVIGKTVKVIVTLRKNISPNGLNLKGKVLQSSLKS